MSVSCIDPLHIVLVFQIVHVHNVLVFHLLFVNMLFVFLVLRSTGRIERLLGEGGIAVLQKVFGIILLAIAVKLFTSNVTHLL